VWLETNHTETLLDHLDLEGEIREVRCLLTFVKQMDVRRLYTWKAPGDQNQCHLHYLLVKHQFRNSMKDVQTLPGADTDSDCNLLIAKIFTTLKKIVGCQKG
jgi:hypothetical protein